MRSQEQKIEELRENMALLLEIFRIEVKADYTDPGQKPDEGEAGGENASTSGV